jgi:hypothetical protein
VSIASLCIPDRIETFSKKRCALLRLMLAAGCWLLAKGSWLIKFELAIYQTPRAYSLH